VVTALRAGVAYEPAQFQEGMIGYGALAALQEGRFVSGVEAAVAQAGGREALAAQIAADPNQVLRFDGAAQAAARIQAALHTRGASVFGTGGQVKQSAYGIQHQAWSATLVSDAAGRLAEVKSLSSSRLTPSDSDNAHLIATVTGPSAAGAGEAPQPTAIVVRAMALAAEAELGAARNDDLPRLQPLLSENSTSSCLRMSKLNLYQCMAVAGPQYEDVFCLGQHALMDTGQCVTKAAGESAPAVPVMASAPPPVQTAVAMASPAPASIAPTDRPFIVPVAHRALASNIN
jgi:hypothetical protein